MKKRSRVKFFIPPRKMCFPHSPAPLLFSPPALAVPASLSCWRPNSARANVMSRAGCFSQCTAFRARETPLQKW